MPAVPGPFQEPTPAFRRHAVAPVSVVIGSLITIVPFVALFPVLPPFGLLLLLGWRLRRPDALPVWAPLPLGLFDDLVSGQPLGSAMLIWMLAFFAIDLIERRMMFRDFWQEWLVAAGATAACLAFGRLVAAPLQSHVDTALLIQAGIAALLYPCAAAIVARLDPGREAA